MTAPDPERHRLSESQHEQIFRDRIIPRELSAGTPQVRPVVYLLGGQPGAGKSRTEGALLAALREHGGAVGIDGDDLRPYHPEYNRLMREDDRTAAFYTDKDSGRWVWKAIQHLADRQVNMVVAGTMRRPGVVREIAEHLKERGYRVEAAIVAAPAAMSRLGIVKRYQEQRRARGAGRFTTRESHDAGYQGVLDTAAALDAEPFVDAVHVYGRRKGQLHTNARTADGEWARPPGLRAAIEAERDRPWGVDEAAGAQADVDRLRQDGEPELRTELDDVARLVRDHPREGTAAIQAAVDEVVAVAAEVTKCCADMDRQIGEAMDRIERVSHGSYSDLASEAVAHLAEARDLLAEAVELVGVGAEAANRWGRAV